MIGVSAILMRLARYVQGSSQLVRSSSDAANVVAFQNRRFRMLVEHCYRNVPYYRKLLRQAGLRPEHIRSLDDLPKIPLTSRADIQFLEPRELCAEGVKPESLLMRRTSGSSGAPLTIRRLWFEERILLAMRLRFYLGMGFGPRTRRVQIENLASAADWRRTLHQAPWQKRLGIFPKISLDWTLPKDELVARIRSFRADLIAGPPSLLAWIADDLSPLQMERIRPRLVGIGGETCTEGMRRQIERGFAAPILEIYGSHEFVTIGWRAPGDAEYRIFGQGVIAEVLREGQPVAPGEDGELTGTALHSFAMPFLRYRLGDLVRRGASNGWHAHSVSSLAMVVGRTMDRFVLASGRVIHPYNVAFVLRDEELWLRRFQIIQIDRNRFLIRIIPYKVPGGEVMAEATRKLATVFGEPVEVQIELVSELPSSASGKFFPYVSLERFRQWDGRPEPQVDAPGLAG
jgi:phenylacetate-CoA ligase